MAHGDREEIKRCVVADDSDFGTLVFIRETVQILEDGASGCGDHTCAQGQH